MLYLVNKYNCNNNNLIMIIIIITTASDVAASFDFIDQFEAVEKHCHEFTCTTYNEVFGVRSVKIE